MIIHPIPSLAIESLTVGSLSTWRQLNCMISDKASLDSNRLSS